MADDLKKSKGVSKLARSEVTSVRLDPKLKYLAELAARKHRRPLSSYIEWAVEHSLRGVDLYKGTGYNNDHDITVFDEASRLWDVDESERFIRLAIAYPELLTHEEQERWKMLSDSEILGPAKRRDASGQVLWSQAKLEDTVYPMVRHHWPELVQAHANGVVSQRNWVSEILRDVRAGRIYTGYPPENDTTEFSPDLDDEIPF